MHLVYPVITGKRQYDDSLRCMDAFLKKIFVSFLLKDSPTGPRGYKTFFMLNSTEYEFFPVYECYNANSCWHFNIYVRKKHLWAEKIAF